MRSKYTQRTRAVRATLGQFLYPWCVLRVGLTGGIACGKSQVLKRLALRGLRTLDLDMVSRETTTRGSAALQEIAREFGPDVLAADGSLDRAALAERVFASEPARTRLNAIVHPRVRAAESAWARTFAARPGEVLVTDGALLVEAGVHLRFDRLVVVHCDAGEQLARLRARDGIGEAAARARVVAQMPLDEKRAFAHWEIDTSGSIAGTERRADELAEELIAAGRLGDRGLATEVETLVGGLFHGPADGPRGLTPDLLLAEARQSGGLEMEGLARRLRPAASRPWYRAAPEAPPGVPATRLALAVAAWALRRGPADPPFLAAAAGSVARLTHTDAGARADACLLALVAQKIAEGAIDPEGEAERSAPLAARFGGGAPSGGLEPVWAAVAGRLREPAAAAAECARAGGDVVLASALAGLGAAVPPSSRASALRAALAGLGSAER